MAEYVDAACLYWNRCSDFRVVDEDGEEALEHVGKRGRWLITGDDLWSDYPVEEQHLHLAARRPARQDRRNRTPLRAPHLGTDLLRKAAIPRRMILAVGGRL